VAHLCAAEGGAWSGLQLERRFGLGAAVLADGRREYLIVHWQDAHDSFFYPRWQFMENSAILPGIREILQIFRSRDPWRMMR
jgi:hypothetical protein